MHAPDIAGVHLPIQSSIDKCIDTCIPSVFNINQDVQVPGNNTKGRRDLVPGAVGATFSGDDEMMTMLDSYRSYLPSA